VWQQIIRPVVEEVASTQQAARLADLRQEQVRRVAGPMVPRPRPTVVGAEVEPRKAWILVVMVARELLLYPIPARRLPRAERSRRLVATRSTHSPLTARSQFEGMQ
jgi:hypothetical protein